MLRQVQHDSERESFWSRVYNIIDELPAPVPIHTVAVIRPGEIMWPICFAAVLSLTTLNGRQFLIHTQMFTAAGLNDVRIHQIEEDPVNCCYIATKNGPS